MIELHEIHHYVVVVIAAMSVMIALSNKRFLDRLKLSNDLERNEKEILLIEN